tara:strand:- start:1450 stop:1812 length:363 start_codon:yes stop_codon:yes gene_type:complete
MPVICSFNKALNTSLQIGDNVYYIPVNTFLTGGFTTTASVTPIELGVCTDIQNTIGNYQVTTDSSATPPNGSFVMFGKDATVNTSGVKGYYAELVFKNSNSTSAKVELFSVSSEVTESSK